MNNKELIIDDIKYRIIYYNKLIKYFNEDLKEYSNLYTKEFIERIKSKIECYEKFIEELTEIKKQILKS